MTNSPYTYEAGYKHGWYAASADYREDEQCYLPDLADESTPTPRMRGYYAGYKAWMRRCMPREEIK